MAISPNAKTEITLNEMDRKILRLLQENADQSIDDLAAKIGSSRTPVWNRIKKLKNNGVIKRTVSLVSAEKIGIYETFFVSIRTDQHSQDWLDAFSSILDDCPEIQEVYRLTGDIDYLMKVKVPNSREFDAFYKRFIDRINLFNVTSSLVMETIKDTTTLKI